MVDNALADWNAVRETYGGDPTLSMIGCELTWFFHLSISQNKVTQNYTKPSLQFQHRKICMDYKDTKTIDDVETKYHVIHS